MVGSTSSVGAGFSTRTSAPLLAVAAMFFSVSRWLPKRPAVCRHVGAVLTPLRFGLSGPCLIIMISPHQPIGPETRRDRMGEVQTLKERIWQRCGRILLCRSVNGMTSVASLTCWFSLSHLRACNVQPLELDECRKLLQSVTVLGTQMAEKDFAHMFLLYNLAPVRRVAFPLHFHLELQSFAWLLTDPCSGGRVCRCPRKDTRITHLGHSSTAEGTQHISPTI